jgi:hypothetical protein|tara:strand:+ start:2080 stop:2280 length:201 start_codon:yes stop_codon:yes gene_type:complete
MKVGDLVKDIYSHVLGLIIDIQEKPTGADIYTKAHILWVDPGDEMKLTTPRSWRREMQIETINEAG